MRTIREYMDEGIKRGYVKNDALIAVKCGVTQATVSRWRSGDRIPEDEEVMELAETLGEDPYEMLAVARYHKAKNEETKTAWEGIVRKIGGLTVILCLLLSHPGDVQAENTLYFNHLLFSELALLIIINGLLAGLSAMTERITLLRYAVCILDSVPSRRGYSADARKSCRILTPPCCLAATGGGRQHLSVSLRSYPSV